jgi:hypothetical protein
MGASMIDIDHLEACAKQVTLPMDRLDASIWSKTFSPATILALTAEVRRLRVDAQRYRRLRSFAHPSYNVQVTVNEHSSSLAKREFLTVRAGTWESMDAVLDGVVIVNAVNIEEPA